MATIQPDQLPRPVYPTATTAPPAQPAPPARPTRSAPGAPWIPGAARPKIAKTSKLSSIIGVAVVGVLVLGGAVKLATGAGGEPRGRGGNGPVPSADGPSAKSLELAAGALRTSPPDDQLACLAAALDADSDLAEGVADNAYDAEVATGVFLDCFTPKTIGTEIGAESENVQSGTGDCVAEEVANLGGSDLESVTYEFLAGELYLDQWFSACF